MPAKRNSTKPTSKARATKPGSSKKSSTKRSGLACPECGFKAQHAMGLGRHRSSRHGVVSQAANRKRLEEERLASRAAKRKAGKLGGALTCPECGFEAAHAMGLGRHRSSRHGVVSQAAALRETAGSGTSSDRRPASPEGWLTRREAALAGGVHYNTVRLWERAGFLRTKTVGRTTLTHQGDLKKHLSAKAMGGGLPVSGGSGLTPSQVFELNEALARLGTLADGLEELARQIRPRRRRGRPPKRGN